MKKNKDYLVLSVAAVLVLAFAGVKQSLAVLPVDLAETNWTMPCATNLSVSRLGRAQAYRPLQMQFDDAGSFSLEMPALEDYDSLSLSGNYSANSKGKVTITETDIDDATLDTLIEMILDHLESLKGEWADSEITNITNYKVKIIATPKLMIDKKNGNQETIKLTVSGKVLAKVVGRYEDWDEEWHETTTRVSLSFKAIAYRNDFAIDATDWTIPCKYSFSVKGLSIKKKDSEMAMALALGAKAAEDDVATFSLLDADGEGFTGTYTTHKGKYIFYPNIEELREHMAAIVEEMNEDEAFEFFGGAFGVPLLRKYSVTGSLRTKPSVEIMSLKVAVSCQVNGDEEDDWGGYELVTHNGSLKITGKHRTHP